MTGHHPGRAISPETVALLRRLRVEYREWPTIYHDLVTISALAEIARDHKIDLTPGETAQSLLTAQQAAEIADISPITIRRACRTKQLPATKNGRDWTITRTALAEWMVRRAT